MTTKIENVNVSLENLVETKLSRSEIIDILLDDIRADLGKRRKELEDQKTSLLASIDQKTLMSLVRKLTVRTDSWYGAGRATKLVIEARTEISTGDLPERLKGLMAQINQNEEEVKAIDESLRTFESKGAKNVLLKRFLEGTEEGRQILEKLDLFRADMGKKLIGAQTKLLSARKGK